MCILVLPTLGGYQIMTKSKSTVRDYFCPIFPIDFSCLYLSFYWPEAGYWNSSRTAILSMFFFFLSFDAVIMPAEKEVKSS